MPSGRFSELTVGTGLTGTDLGGGHIEIEADPPAPPVVVDSLAAEGETPLTGDITLSEGSNVTLTQVGQDIEIAATSSGAAVTDTHAWMPLTTVTAGVPELVWDGDDQLIPTIVSI